MNQPVPTVLRNAADRKTLKIRKKDPLELREFVKEWRLRLRREGTEWDGPRAVAELQQKNLFEFLLCEKRSATEWQAQDLFGRIRSEMKAYRKEAEQKLLREYFDDIDKFLDGMRRKIQQKEENKTNLRELKSLLKDLGHDVERTQKAVRWLRKRKTNWHFGVWRHFWPKIPRTNLVSRTIDLDTRLQIELGKMFSDYLRLKNVKKVKWETIARLILLAYRVGGLAGMDGEVTRTILTSRVLNVRNIRDKLKYSGLWNAASFKRNRGEM
jgi:hypothetical protein